MDKAITDFFKYELLAREEARLKKIGDRLDREHGEACLRPDVNSEPIHQLCKKHSKKLAKVRKELDLLLKSYV